MSDPDAPRPWNRLPGEPVSWYLRFKRFCQMGQGRSFLRLYNLEREAKGLKKAINGISGAWKTKVEVFHWKDRAAAFDAFMVEREERNAERARRAYLKREMKLADNLIKKAEQMLQFPLARTEQRTATEDGKTVNNTVILPARWSMRDSAALIDTADKLMRLAQTMETERNTTEIVLGDSIEEIRSRRWKAAAEALGAWLADEPPAAVDPPPADGK